MGAAACAVALVVPGGAAAQLRWTGPLGHDPGGTGAAIVAVACPAASTCVAALQSGGVVAFDPGAPRYAAPVMIDPQPPTGLACPSAGPRQQAPDRRQRLLTHRRGGVLGRPVPGGCDP